MVDNAWQQALQLLDAYFRRIDGCISIRLERPSSPRETTLTDELIALLDTNVRDYEHEYDPGPGSVLKSDILKLASRERGGWIVDTDLTSLFEMSTTDHGGWYESNVSQADFGLVIEQSSGTDEPALRSVYLLQAKKLRSRLKGQDRYSLSSSFSARSKEQEKEAIRLEDVIGKKYWRYLYYMPTRDKVSLGGGYDRNKFARVKQSTYSQDESGMWVSRSSTPSRTAIDVYATAVPFARFMVGHFEIQISNSPAQSIRPQCMILARETPMKSSRTGSRPAI